MFAPTCPCCGFFFCSRRYHCCHALFVLRRHYYHHHHHPPARAPSPAASWRFLFFTRRFPLPFSLAQRYVCHRKSRRVEKTGGDCKAQRGGG